MAGIQLVLDLKNKLNEALGRADKQVDQFAARAQKRLDGIKAPTQAYKGLDANKLKMIQGIRDEVPVINSAMMMAGSTASIVGVGIATLGTGLAYAARLSREWEQGMAEVNVTASRDLKAMGWTLSDLSNKMRQIGREAPVDIMQVPIAFNKIVSSGLDVNTSLATLIPVLKASKAGFTDLETTAKATVQVMGGAGMKDAGKVLDILFATQRKGNATFQDIAQYFPKLVSGSKNLGLSLEQTAGSWAFLSTKMSAEQSTIGLQNLLKALADGRIQKNFKANKIELFNKDGSVKEVIDIIQSVKAKTAGLSDRGRTKFLDLLGLDMEAGGALAAMINDIDYLKSSINDVKGSAGSLNKAFLDSATSMDMMTMIGNKFKADLMGTGDDILLVLKPVLKFVYENYDTIKTTLLQIGTLGFYELYRVTYQFRHNIVASIESFKTYFTVAWANIKTIYQGIAGMGAGVGKILSGMKNRNLDEIRSGISDVVKSKDSIANGYINSDQRSKMAQNAYNLAHVNSRLRENKGRADLAKASSITDSLLKPTGAGADYMGGGASRINKGGAGDGSNISSGGRGVQIVIHGGLIGKLDVNITELNGKVNSLEIEKVVTESLMKAIRNVETNYN